MGTPQFAVPALGSLINSSNHQVVAVFTQEPKSQDRGLRTKASPVHELAQTHKVPVYTPRTLKDLATDLLIKSIEADVIVVAAYGFIVPKNILEAKRYGCINIHPSLLPKYRGAAPLQRTIINGEIKTGVCIMQMDEGLDTGDIMLQEEFLIDQRTAFHALHDKCALLGAKMLIDTLDQIESLPKIKQNNDNVTYAHKLSKEEGKIDWNQSAYQIDCKIRGMNPWPGTYFYYNDKTIKIIEADYKESDSAEPVGSVISDELEVSCGSGILIIKKLQQSNKNPLFTAEFLRGLPIVVGSLLQ